MLPPMIPPRAILFDWDNTLVDSWGATDAAHDKPAPEAVAAALAGSGLAPGAMVWLVGDARIDTDCAGNAGCVPVLLWARPPEAGEFGAIEPALHFPDCRALAAALAAR
jgi:phosphoglycolate phosphatase